MVETPTEKLWISEDETQWKNELSNYYARIKPEHLEIEEEMIKYNISTFEEMSPEEWYTFLLEKYFKWKYTQANRYASTTKYLKKYKEENKLEELNLIKNEFIKLDKANIKAAIETVSKIKGLGPIGASGLLALLYPKLYGTVDQFVVKALMEIREYPELKRIELEDININQAEYVINILKMKADDLNKLFSTDFWTPRKIDMILWSFR